ncbi:oxygenase MpaB family protein [Nocardioides panacisoli]|uniref:Oxygenase MpaB family protein n=1 Tax=Nocardioides panacisoli TaxID=627624 RepID=A0ABP7HVM0_9ACTN
MRSRGNRTVEPAEDYGFFGPDSVTWKVWSYPTSLTVGFIRSVVVEELDPDLVAAVDKTHDIYKRPRTRYDRTLRYFSMVAFGGSRETAKAADVLVKIHSKAIGTEPYAGGRYDANAPHSQLWIHLTAWHSILYAYERYGPGKLPPEEEAQYWAECAVAAELQTCDPADVPRTREGITVYFEQMRPLLSGSPIAVQAMRHLLNGGLLVSPLPRWLLPVSVVNNLVLRAGVVATLPRWMREMGGIRQPRVVDALVRPVLWLVFRMSRLNTDLQLQFLRGISPGTVPIVEPVLRGIPPRNPEVLTPAEARARYGYDRPVEAHLEWRAQQRDRVFGAGEAPSDAGLHESEPILGRL